MQPYKWRCQATIFPSLNTSDNKIFLKKEIPKFAIWLSKSHLQEATKPRTDLIPIKMQCSITTVMFSDITLHVETGNLNALVGVYIKKRPHLPFWQEQMLKYESLSQNDVPRIEKMKQYGSATQKYDHMLSNVVRREAKKNSAVHYSSEPTME